MAIFDEYYKFKKSNKRMPINIDEKTHKFKKPILRKRKRQQVTPSELKFIRTGPCDSLKISNLKKQYTAFLEKLQTFTATPPPSNAPFSVGDLKVPSTSTQISAKISALSREIAKDAHLRPKRGDREKMYAKAFSVRLFAYTDLEECFEDLRETTKSREAVWDRDNVRLARTNKISTARPLRAEGCFVPAEAVIRVEVHDFGDSKTREELLVLGRNSLDSFRKQIKCSNYSFDKSTDAFSVRSDLLNTIETENKGRLYIEDEVFCCGASNSAADDFAEKDAETVLFEDLTVRVGSLYFYAHKVDCKHIFVVKEMRMLQKEDNLNLKEYPLRIYERKDRYQNCEVCEEKYADYCVYGNSLVPRNPFLFCAQCFRMMNCDSSGKRLEGDSEVYRCNLE